MHQWHFSGTAGHCPASGLGLSKRQGLHAPGGWWWLAAQKAAPPHIHKAAFMHGGGHHPTAPLPAPATG